MTLAMQQTIPILRSFNVEKGDLVLAGNLDAQPSPQRMRRIGE
jgi:hypothetical protein